MTKKRMTKRKRTPYVRPGLKVEWTKPKPYDNARKVTVSTSFGTKVTAFRGSPASAWYVTDAFGNEDRIVGTFLKEKDLLKYLRSLLREAIAIGLAELGEEEEEEEE